MTGPQRPALVTVLSVFNILLGILALLCGSGCGAMTAWFFSIIGQLPVPPGEPSPKELFDIFARNFPGYQAVAIATFVLMGIEGVFLIVSGSGALLLKKWGRYLTIFTGLAICLHSLALLGYYSAIIVPNQVKMQNDVVEYGKRMEQAQKNKGGGRAGGPPPPAFGNMQAANQSANHMFNFLCMLACLAYGGGMVVVMLLPGTRAAFEPAPSFDTDESERERRRLLLEEDDFERYPDDRRT